MSSKEEDAEYEKYKKRYTITADPKPVWLKRERETNAKIIKEAKAREDYKAMSIPEKIAFKEKQIADAQAFIDSIVKKAEERGKYNNLEPDLIKKFQTDIKLIQLEIRELKPAKPVKSVKPPPARKRVVEPKIEDEDIPDEDEPVEIIYKTKIEEEPKLLWINEPLAAYENIFIETTALGALELDNVKGDVYIPERFIVKKYKEISPKDLEDNFLPIKEVDIDPSKKQNENKPKYFLSIPPINITLDKKSPYYFKTITYKNDTPIYIKLGKFRRYGEIPFYIAKEDIKLDEFDTPNSPYGEKYFDYDENIDAKWKKYVKKRVLGTTINPNFKREIGAFEGVSKKTAAERELASYINEPEKIKDKPLTMIELLERLPIPEDARKEGISQLKKSYKKQQLEDAPDRELVKELIKVIPKDYDDVPIEL